jgi:outer membrane protein assembly factor BamB
MKSSSRIWRAAADRTGLPGLCWVAAASLAVAWLGSASALASSARTGRAPATKLTQQDWPAYLFSAAHSSATTGPATITRTNARSLTAAWVFRQQPPTGLQPPGGFTASPTGADGLVFIGSQTGDFYALSESTGQLMWERTLDYEQVGNNGNCKNARGIVGTATVAPDPVTGRLTVYAAGARYLYALDAATGALNWKALVGPPGSAAVPGAYYNYGSPTVAAGMIYMGVSASCNDPFVRGGVQSFGQHTGKLLHSFWTDPAGHAGASVWSSEATQTGTGSIWATTGDPDSSGTHLYHAYSFLWLNSRTLALRGAWQLKLSQSADLDFGSSPTLFTGTIGGTPTPLVGACNKNGRFYTLRRNDLSRGPVWSRQIGASADTGQGLCLTSAVWNRHTSRLYLAGNATTIGGTHYDGSIREVNPGTGKVEWATGLPCEVLGTPALDAASGLLAVATWARCNPGKSPAVYLLDAASGAILGVLPLAIGAFAQPVFAGANLIVADESGQITAYRPAAAGPVRCTGWCTAGRGPSKEPVIPAP